MTRKFAILLVLTIAALFLGLSLTAYGADVKAASKKAAEMKAQAVEQAVARASHQQKDMLRWDGTGESDVAVQPRSFAPLISQAASPYILMHQGVREADNNGAWKRHAVYRGAVGPGRTIHVLYPVFDNVAATNNRHQYNCLASGAVVMSYNNPEGTNNEPRANPAQADQNGGLHASFGDATTAQAVWAGRGIGGNTGTIYNEDASSCLGLITTANTPVVPARGLDPDLRVVSAGASPDSIVVFISYFNANATIGSTRSLDGGVTWSVPIDCASSSFLSIAPANSPSNPKVIYVFTMGLADSSAGDDVEEILMVKSIDAGATWSPTVSVSGPFELPTYIPQFNGSITAIMIGDTAHCLWADHTHGLNILPGGHIHHVAVEPSGAIQGPHKVADINIFYDINYDYSATGFGLGHGLWAGGSGPSVARSASTGVMYVLWGAPPEDPLNPGRSNDSTNLIGGTREFWNNDIWCCASATNGRNWDSKTNVTLTNHNDCDGVIVPCEHEFYLSAAEVADTSIYVVAQVQKQPGLFILGGEAPGTSDTRLSDEWRLYLIPARGVKKTAACDFKVTSPDNLSALQVTPGGLEAATFDITNSGLVDLRLDSILFTGTLNGAQLVTSKTAGANFGDPIPQLTSASVTITFDASGVSYAQSGLRNGQIQVWTHTNDTAGLVGPATALCQLGANVYVVSKLCLNSADTIHSASNFTEIWSHSVEVFAASVNGMFYFATGENFIFDGGKAIYNPALAGPPNHPRSLRNYFDDQFLRCLSPIVLDSIPDPTDPPNSFEIYAKVLSTGRFDSTIVWETIWRQSTNPAYSDFLVITNKVVNISGADLPNVILGHANDIDVPTNFIRGNENGMTGPVNLSFDTTFTPTSDPTKQYRLLVLAGADTTGESGTSPPHYCTPNDKYFGVLCLPDGAASPSPVQARGAVIHNNRTLVLGNQWVDSTFCRNLDATGYHTARNLGDPLTGMDTMFILDSCPNGGGVDIGFIIGAKKVTLPNNTVVKDLLTIRGGGLSGLAASIDTLTLPGPSESYTVIMVTSLSGLADLMTNADAAIDWYNQTDSVQEGGSILFHRGDADNNGILTSADVVRQLNYTFLGQNPSGVLDCVYDHDLNGFATSADVVRLLNYTFLGQIYPGYPNLPDLLGCL